MSNEGICPRCGGETPHKISESIHHRNNRGWNCKNITQEQIEEFNNKITKIYRDQMNRIDQIVSDWKIDKIVSTKAVGIIRMILEETI